MAKGIFRYSKDGTEYRDYPFEGSPMPGAHSSQTKQILKIRFTGEVPEDGPFYSGRDYCLKIVTVYPRRSGRPADRDYWDAADFRGDHLMHHIALDENGDIISRQLRRDGRIDESLDGRKVMILEPDGLSLFDLINDRVDPSTDFIDLASLPVTARLDILDQICEGLQELYRHVQRDGRRIVAYRDLKEENVVILMEGKRMVASLIDFATIRLEDSDGNSPNNTFRSQFSESNTAPEDIVPENDPVISFYQTSGQNQKTDVFALGLILGRLFSGGRPLRDWIHKAQMTETDSEKLWLHAYEDVISRYQTRDFRWLEKELGEDFRWQEEIDSAILNKVQRLFRQSTLLWPDARPGIDLFRQRLGDILDLAITREGPLEDEEEEEAPGPAPEKAAPEGAPSQGETGKEKGEQYCLFLLNTSVPAEMMGSYRLAMEDAWRKELKKHKKTGEPPASFMAGFITFRSGNGADPCYAKTEMPLHLYTHDYLMNRLLPQTVSLTDMSGSAARGFRDAFIYVRDYLQEEGNQSFLGSVCIFTPFVPSFSELEEVQFGDILDECGRLSIERYGRHLQVVIYSDPEKRNSDDAADWYDEKNLRISGLDLSGTGTGGTKNEPGSASIPPVWDYPFYEESSSSGSGDTDPDTEEGFFVGPDALYAVGPGGREIYVLRRKTSERTFP
ncbi:MAG: protein kinase family protein [Lachnospiraceae bacterium]|nr:protein kinase family protein [Lachnospiraceae bacterium]